MALTAAERMKKYREKLKQNPQKYEEVKKKHAERVKKKVIHFYSDGPCTQYRQKKNFFLHNFFTFKLGLEYSTWSFTESGHGKSVADGIGGAVKRSLDKQVAYGKDISNGEQAVELLSNSMKSVKCLYVINSDIENVAKLVPSDLTPLTGTMQIHQIIANSPGIIQYRSLSCFCGLKRGLCDCFGLNTHTYGKSTKKTELNRSNPSNKVTVTAEIHEVPISQKTKIATCSSTQKYFEQNEDIIELDIERDEGKYKEEQERVEEINDATFKTKEEEKNRLEEVNDGVTVGCKDKEQDKLEETINAVFDSIIIPLDDDLLFNLNNIEDLSNFEIFNETGLKSEENKLISHKLHNEQYNKISKKRYYTKEENCDIQPKKIPKRSKENHSYNKSIRNVVSRHAECPQCEIRKPLQLMQKCMACKKFVCLSCNDCQIPKDSYNDFICDICLGG
ncbi:hypothetical protein HF086_016490 [Spodoptera exigua]|uniref:Uncharacterized protein n=1 Tax=Spodoptera exigua TaxID=7107 RepID=A0A922SN86_SPOEX|nr:hypothetical protein HF086_016490 [Spodoptera exigua]